MDVQLERLANDAGLAVARLLATDDWQVAERAVHRLWQAADPARAPMVAAELRQSRDELVGTGAAQPMRDARDALVAEWRARLKRLLVVDPERAIALAAVLEEDLAPALRGAAPGELPAEPGPGGRGVTVTGSFSDFVTGMNVALRGVHDR
ncbi:hypothetical protein [Symbioplanes lichenis]|uniref:hypothetical protein n=1 Tax=Symbioplanes lichenis TaxID=1629072 RepID=UPI00273A29F1|nr:hypothetical protein [Actinoplanes lichenis]